MKLKSSVKDIRTILLNKVFWNSSDKNKLRAGMINFDNLLLSVKFITRVQGNYVTIQFNIPKNFTIFKLKIKVETFNIIFSKLKRISNNINKESANSQ